MISNSSPIIFLAKINKLNFLKDLFGGIKIPSAVKNEILIQDKIEVKSIEKAIKDGLIKIEDPKKEFSLGLGKGEEEAINLALENKDSLIIDDALGIKAARSLNIEVLRLTAVILLAQNKGLITKKEALQLINRAIEHGYYIIPKYYAEMVDKLKE